MNQKSDGYNEHENEVIIKQYELLFNAKLAQARDFAKYTFFISSIAFSASLSLIKFSKAIPIFLFLALLCFLAGMNLALFSMLRSIATIEERIKELLGENPSQRKTKVPVNSINYLILIFITSGALLLTLSIGGTLMKQPPKPNTQINQKTFDPPPLLKKPNSSTPKPSPAPNSKVK